MKIRTGILLGVVLATGLLGATLPAQTAEQRSGSPAQSPGQTELRTVEPPSTGDESARATVLISGSKPRALLPDLTGCFPALRIPGDAILQVKVTYPDGTPGEMVRIEAAEKRQSGGDRIISQGRLDPVKSISFRIEMTSSRLHSGHKWTGNPLLFRFRTTHGSQLYRITLRKGRDEKTS